MEETNIGANEVQPEAPAPELIEARSHISELETALAQQSEELRAANERIIELEKTRSGLEARLSELGNSLTQSIAEYKGLVNRSNPGVLEELISGDSIVEINASLEKARALVGRVKQGLEAEAVRIKVPAGAPPRRTLELTALTSREKIMYAIGGK